MNLNAWSPDERAQYEDLRRESCECSTVARKRNEFFVIGLHRAVREHRTQQGQRFWASEVLVETRLLGADKLLKDWAKSNRRVLVAIDDAVVQKPAELGARRRDDEGRSWHARVMFELMTWDEIKQRVRDRQSQILAEQGSVAMMRKLLDLQELAPGTATPAEAAEHLGIDLESYLGKAASC